MTSTTRLATAAALVGCAAAGCNGVLGIHDKEAIDSGAAQPELQLSLTSQRLRIVRGQSASVELSIRRNGGFTGSVTVAATGMPSGVTSEPLSVSAEQIDATLTFRAATSADRGSAMLQIYALSDAISAKSQSLQLIVQDAPGSPDLTFGAAAGAGGRVSLAFGSGAAGVGSSGLKLVPQTGAVVVCGYARTDAAQSSIALARLNADGSPDFTFGEQQTGIVLGNSPGSSNDACNAMFLRTGGGINLAGFAEPVAAGPRAILVGRYTPAGKIDANTGDGGFVVTPIGADDAVANGLLPAAGDGYLAGGASKGGATFAQYLKYRGIDVGFGVNGVTTIGPEGTAARWLDNQSSGNIVAAVASAMFRVVRLTPVGRLDTAFGSGGIADVGAMGSSAVVVLVTPQPKDALLVVGTAPGPGGARDVAAVRLTDSGQVDPNYGSSGWALAHFGGAQSFVSAAALQDDGALVVAGQTPTASGPAFSVVRFTPAGMQDTAFGPGGRQTFDPGGVAQAVVLDDLGRIIAAGTAGSAGGVVVYRLWP